MEKEAKTVAAVEQGGAEESQSKKAAKKHAKEVAKAAKVMEM